MDIEELQAKMLKYKKALEDIRDYAKNHPGFGYTCYKKAEEALEDDNSYIG